jgi:sugar phosphate isomerase/epimerase
LIKTLQNELWLCSGTVAQAGYRELVECARLAGFDGISLWRSHYKAAVSEGLSLNDMKLLLDDNNLKVTELDALLTLIPGDKHYKPEPPMVKYDPSFYLDVASALGARSINVVQMYGPQIPSLEAAEIFSEFCIRAQLNNLLATIEFFPASGIPNLLSATEIVTAADQCNGGVNFDTWHFHRSGGAVQDIRILNADIIKTVQISDAGAEPWKDITAETLANRLIPGEGVITLHSIIAELRAIGCTVPLSIEVFNKSFSAMPVAEVIQKQAEALRKFIESQ